MAQKLKIWWDEFVFIAPSFGLGVVAACIFFFAGVWAGVTPSIYLSYPNDFGEWVVHEPISSERLEFKIKHYIIDETAYAWEYGMKGWVKLSDFPRAKKALAELPPDFNAKAQ